MLRIVPLLCAVLLTMLPAQESLADAPVVLELRTADPGFAGAAQELLHAPPWDPRPAGDPGSIRLRLRHAVAAGSRACETSIGPPLAAGTFAEMELDPAAALAAFAPEITALRKTWLPRLDVLTTANRLRGGTAASVLESIVDGLGQLTSVRVRFTADPRPATSTFTCSIDVVAKGGGSVRQVLDRLKPAGTVRGDATGLAGEIVFALDLGVDDLAALFGPSLDAFVAAEPGTDAAVQELATMRSWLAALDGTVLGRATTDLRTSLAIVLGVRDPAAAWRMCTDPKHLAARRAAAEKQRRTVDYTLDAAVQRDVAILKTESTSGTGAAERTDTSFLAVAGRALLITGGKDALARMRELIENVLDDKLPRVELPTNTFAWYTSTTPGAEGMPPVVVRAHVAKTERGLALELSVSR